MRLLALKTQADLAIGDSAAALDDFTDIMQGCRALTDEPFAVSVGNKVSSLHNGIVAIGEGLREHQWSDVQLASVETELKKADVTADYSRFLTGERAQFNDYFGTFAKSTYLERKAILDRVMGRQEAFDWIFALLPPHFYRHNQLRYNRHIDDCQSRLATAPYSPDPQPSAPSQSGPSEYFERYYLFTYRMWSGWIPSEERRHAFGEVQLRQARIACALERYYLLHGEFPENLSSLVPQFLESVPTDLYSGKPMIYRPHEKQSYALYSVGPNRVDDYAAIDTTKKAQRQLDDIWLYAPHRK